MSNKNKLEEFKKDKTGKKIKSYGLLMIVGGAILYLGCLIVDVALFLPIILLATYFLVVGILTTKFSLTAKTLKILSVINIFASIIAIRGIVPILILIDSISYLAKWHKEYAKIDIDNE